MAAEVLELRAKNVEQQIQFAVTFIRSLIQLQHRGSYFAEPVLAVVKRRGNVTVDQTSEQEPGARQKAGSEERAKEEAIGAEGEREVKMLSGKTEEVECRFGVNGVVDGEE